MILANILFCGVWLSQFHPKVSSEPEPEPEPMDECEETLNTRVGLVDGPEETPETRVGHCERSDSHTGAPSPSAPTTSHMRILRSSTIASRNSQTNLRNVGGGELEGIE
jgi:hypothetical protein